MTTAEWRAKYEKDGTVDLFVEEEFNAGSRLVGGRAVHWGGVAGYRSGEGPSAGEVPVHTVTIHNPRMDQTVTVEVPEDRWAGGSVGGFRCPQNARLGVWVVQAPGPWRAARAAALPCRS
jgi:ferredoxin